MNSKRKRISWAEQGIKVLVTAAVVMMLFVGTVTHAAQTDPFSVFYDALMGTLEAGSFSYGLEISEKSDGDYGYDNRTFFRGNMECSLPDRVLTMQVASGSPYYKNDSLYIYVKNGSYGLYNYNEKEWEEGFEPDLSELFKVLQGDLVRVPSLFMTYRSFLDIGVLPYDMEKVVDCFPHLLQTLQSAEVLEDVLHFTNSGEEYAMDVNLNALIQVLLAELKPAYIGQEKYDVFSQELLRAEAEELEEQIDLKVSFMVDDGKLTALNAAMTEYHDGEQRESVLETEMDTEIEQGYAYENAFYLTLDDIGTAKIYAPNPGAWHH